MTPKAEDIREVDVKVENLGTLFTFDLISTAARNWTTENVPDPLMLGGFLCVNHHYARDLADGMIADGLKLV